VPAGQQDRAAAPELNRRDDLLRAAARLFVEKGFAATTTRDIAQAVGMRSGSPFYHFRSKQDLLKAAMIEGLESGHQRLQAAIAGIDDPERRLRLMIRTHFGNLLEGDCHTPMLISRIAFARCRGQGRDRRRQRPLPGGVAGHARRTGGQRPAAQLGQPRSGCCSSACSTGAASGIGPMARCRSTRLPTR
jgi:AcrR family transcriptional regulator